MLSNIQYDSSRLWILIWCGQNHYKITRVWHFNARINSSVVIKPVNEILLNKIQFFFTEIFIEPFWLVETYFQKEKLSLYGWCLTSVNVLIYNDIIQYIHVNETFKMWHSLLFLTKNDVQKRPCPYIFSIERATLSMKMLLCSMSTNELGRQWSLKSKLRK